MTSFYALESYAARSPQQNPGAKFGLTRRAFMARLGQGARQTAGWTIGGRLAPIGLGGLGRGCRWPLGGARPLEPNYRL